MGTKKNTSKLVLAGLIIGTLLALTAAEPADPSEDNITENNLSEETNNSQNQSEGFVQGITSWFQNLLNSDGNESNNNTTFNESNNTINESDNTTIYQ